MNILMFEIVGKFVGDTKCEKLPVEICGAGCVTTTGEEECHDKTVTSLIDVPEEVCDLSPQKICKFQTKLVPKLQPKHECTIIPKETCHLKFDTPKPIDKDLRTKWCLDDTPATPDETYDEEDAIAFPLGREGRVISQSQEFASAQSQQAAIFVPPESTPIFRPQSDNSLPVFGPPPPIQG